MGEMSGLDAGFSSFVTPALIAPVPSGGTMLAQAFVVG